MGTTSPVQQQGELCIRNIYVTRKVLTPGLNEVMVHFGHTISEKEKEKKTVRLEAEVGSSFCQEHPRMLYV